MKPYSKGPTQFQSPLSESVQEGNILGTFTLRRETDSNPQPQSPQQEANLLLNQVDPSMNSFFGKLFNSILLN